MIERMPPAYEPLALLNESTVVAEFLPEESTETAYQSEAELERDFIQQLKMQAYEYLPISAETDLIANLRQQLEKLNKISFSDAEWSRFFSTSIAGASDGLLEKTTRIQEDHIQILTRDDGTAKNIYLLDKARIHNNTLQVINQYEAQGNTANRYDVTILVNGLPLVHVELKRRGVHLREAFNQINRYQRDSFWSGTGLFEYVQLFVISNGTYTKYYSNTVRDGHLSDRAREAARRQTSHSYSFTSWWADAKNRTITDLTGFAKTFFARHTLLNILTKYCVFDVDRKLLVMRPYQIVAVEQILQRVHTSGNETKKLGKKEAGGYIWHTTGSGKTLTSFKAAQLVRTLPEIEKVLFVVDRKDLDYQTMREYERFEKGAANSNTSTKVLQKQLEDPNSSIIITTIQKLSRLVTGSAGHPAYSMRAVIIFDECHRSQFGKMHSAITRAFKNCHLFGFTGTPIFAENSNSQGNPGLQTTDQVFGDRLHTYTVVDAINDKNVLPFRIDYINTIKTAPDIENKEVSSIDTERALLASERVKQVAAYILEHFDQKTKRTAGYRHQGSYVKGFNSIFATASIEAAKRYYTEFEAQQKSLPCEKRLKIGLIYSAPANEDSADGLLGEESFETGQLDKSSRDFLTRAIGSYNKTFKMKFSASSDKFENYYRDISLRLKSRELDLAIVVNMFLTGFDATTVNTLWLDKNLQKHGLLQAYSRTNRILNSVKSYGNIVSFRNLEDQTKEAFALFGNKDALSIAILKPYSEYEEEYRKMIERLLSDYPPGEHIEGEAAQKNFVKLFGQIARLRNILTSFDDFQGSDFLSDRDLQNYQGVYLHLHDHFRSERDADSEFINDDLIFEIELMKQVEVNVDYILMLVEETQKDNGETHSKEIRAKIERAVGASPSLRDKKDLIDKFVESVSAAHNVNSEWSAFIKRAGQSELADIIRRENLNEAAAIQFIDKAFRDGALSTTGTAVTDILPPASRFGKDRLHAQKKQKVLSQLNQFFNRFYGMG